MRRTTVFAAGLLGLALATAGFASPAPKERNSEQTRDLTGQVIDKSDRPLGNAIVYLTNTRTRVVKTFIADAQGKYAFHALSPNTDYQVYAEYKGMKSDTKTLSSFDSRQNVVMHLRINTQK